MAAVLAADLPTDDTLEPLSSPWFDGSKFPGELSIGPILMASWRKFALHFPMRPLILLLPGLLAVACGPGTTAVHERNLEGEVSIQPGDTVFMPCGALRSYRISGPGLDSIAGRYAYLVTKPGQWIKTWCQGYLVPAGNDGRDSMISVTRYMHMDAEVHCRPIPDATTAGSYRKAPAGIVPSSQEQLLLFPNGDATSIITNMDNMQIESDGRWGINSGGLVALSLLQPKFTYLYKPGPHGLQRILPDGAIGGTYAREGPADRMQGTFGRTARWLASVATANGHAVTAEDLRPAMLLDSLFPDPASRAALRASASDTLVMDEDRLNKVWPTADNVQEVNILMRMHLRTGR